MPRSTDRPSIRDVAAQAGVSYQTVSRVLNEPDRVTPATRARVQKVIDKLGYRPNKVARALATNESMMIGVVTIHATLFGPIQTHYAIDEGARARGYIAATVTIQDDSQQSLDEAREQLLALGVEGVVISAWSAPVLGMAERIAERIPTVVIADGEVPESMARVSADNYTGAQLAVQALLASGRRRIGHLAGPTGWLEAEARRAGWRDAAGDNAGPLVEASWRSGDGYAGVDEMIAAGVDAIFAANDLVAVGAIRRLTERGLSVPDDVAIVGYDDEEIAPYLTVPLASVKQPFAELGVAAIDLLFELMNGAQPSTVRLHAKYRHRESAGAVDPAEVGE
ncbi:MAG TPA: LacI family transcriptional regulator [Tessaracoccus flavescens]|uniref:LacI family transcriptional regulator n=1 Tax=Tessaracoccus flavescens TaxID=399497 RepID=A0A921END8_9ACTN|nr:LacI family transcriptional regulator [Tessaracoccus flavescens]